MYSFTLPLTSALKWGWVVSATPGRFTPGKDPVPIVQESGWAPGPVWTGVENLAPTGIRSPDRAARSDFFGRTKGKTSLQLFSKDGFFFSAEIRVGYLPNTRSVKNAFVYAVHYYQRQQVI